MTSFFLYKRRIQHIHKIVSVPLSLLSHVPMDEEEHDIIIVGAGIAGLATALGLHRIGIRSLVLESTEQLRSSGFALTTWSNAWRALDELGIGDKLRKTNVEIEGLVAISSSTGLNTSSVNFKAQGKHGIHEVRCLRRNLLVQSLGEELPQDTIRLGAKLVSIEEDGTFKILHLADGSTLRTKGLVGCDGVNSVVAKWLGLKRPYFTSRSAVRGIAEFPYGHGYRLEFLQTFGDGFRSGLIPCDDKHIYWFFTWSPSEQEREIGENPTQLKQFVLDNLGNVPERVIDVVQRTSVDGIICSPLRCRSPFDLLWGRTHKDNVCLAGDAFHAMTPDIGQGGCSSLEDGVVLARCLGKALAGGGGGDGEGSDFDRIKKGMEEYVEERKWRCFELITTAYVVGLIQQSNGKVINFLRDNMLSNLMAKKLLQISDFDFGKLQ